ncbi:MAG: Bax inhibitor-1/YccA family protein [Chlorobia bacterium]|nr:Bax inhibitor-1/YccA family protein [Fimbriimonadaceae bacterium]
MALTSSNPILSENSFNRHAYLTGEDPGTMMSINGTLNKALILAVLVVASSVLVWQAVAANQSLAMPLLIAGALGGLIIALVINFKMESAPILAPAYAVVEGLFIGSISQILNVRYPGIVAQAIVITLAIMLTMLGLYRTGIIKASPMFVKIVSICTIGIGVTYLISFGMAMFGSRMPFIHESTPLGIGISLFTCGIAALNFIIDFDMIEKGAERGQPKYMEWFGAFGLMVTLVWLYIEVLRLLRKLRG